MQSQPPTAVNVRVNAIPLLSRPPKSTQGSCIVRSVYVMFIFFYERWLISNAHSEISRKRDHVFKQTKVRSKVQYFSYKLTYFIFRHSRLVVQIHFSQRKTSLRMPSMKNSGVLCLIHVTACFTS